MYYIMLFIATILFSVQFLFNKKYEEEQGTSFNGAMVFSLFASLISFVVLMIINRLKLSFSVFSACMALVYAIISILYNIIAIKSLGMVNLSVFSVFAMLGGMVLPSVFGIAFYDESVTVLKTLSFVMIAVALFFAVDFKEKSGKKIYYFLVFMLNGLVGVVSVIHQQNVEAVDSMSFYALSMLISAIISLVICLIKRSFTIKITWKTNIYMGGYAVFCSVGNLLVLLALKHLAASVQYPIITGGVIFFSLLISLVRKEKVTYKNVVSAIIAFIATLLLL